MPPRDVRTLIQDILDAMGRVERYIRGMTYEQFQADDKTVDAVVRNIQIIGEAARHVPADVQEHHPSVPWGRMRGMRSIVIHQYHDVSLPIIWQTVTQNLPPIVPLLDAVLLDYE